MNRFRLTYALFIVLICLLGFHNDRNNDENNVNNGAVVRAADVEENDNGFDDDVIIDDYDDDNTAKASHRSAHEIERERRKEEENEGKDEEAPWPGVMPERRHLQKYRVRELKDFLDLRGASCNACAEKSDWINKVEETWNWPKVVEEVVSEASKRTGDDLTPEEELAEDARMRKMMNDLNNEPDYAKMDPKRARLLKKLKSKGLSFMGGEGMEMDQLENLVKAMDGIKNPGSGGSEF